MKNPYARVIEELQKNQNWRGIVFSVARFAPSAILRAIAEEAKQNEPEWVKQCRNLVRAGQKIEAIKIWRAQTDAGLKEAKDAVEAL